MVRGGLAGMVLLVGCFSADAPAGAPCDRAADNCPSGQTCQSTASGDHCVETATPDAAVALGDGDGDGVLDFLDNCVAVRNPGQEDEDLDGHGDACDHCPPLASSEDPDGDGDGVGDACDPHPRDRGDRLALFEGFAHGIPDDWTATGQWLGIAGGAFVMANGNDVASLVIPVTGATNQTLRAGVTIVALTQNTGGSVGVVSRVGGTQGVQCGSGRAANSSAGLFGIVNVANNTFLKSVPHSFATGDELDLVLASTGSSHTCLDVIAEAVVSETVSSMNANVGLRARVATASFDWVMLVTSP